MIRKGKGDEGMPPARTPAEIGRAFRRMFDRLARDKGVLLSAEIKRSFEADAAELARALGRGAR